MTAKEEILGKVRKSLGRTEGQAIAAPPPVRIRIPELPREKRVALFQQRLEVLGGKVYEAATLADARRLTEQILAGATAITTKADILKQAGIHGIANVQPPPDDDAAFRQACATCAFGITSADYGLAETGSVVTRSASEARLASLLPPAHIAILPMSRLLSGLDELFTLVPRPPATSASTVFITGPSRSADIEMILVRGVHGPKVIHVIVVAEA
ncbi:MAG: lactate utilization protein [Bryobacterales bacterium]|nr:lactate utilization protein [Bryobacterales bacterium]